MDILIIEDNESQALMLHDLLELSGIGSTIATNGKQVVSLLEDSTGKMEKIGLILLDIKLPDISGFEVCEILKKDPISKDIPIIFMTGHVRDDYLQKAFDAGASDYIQKPYRSQHIIPRLKSHLDRHRLLKQSREAHKKLNDNYKQIKEMADMLHQQIEEKKVQDEKLEQSERRFILASQSVNAGQFHFDLIRNQMEWDKRSFEIFGLKEQEFDRDFSLLRSCIHPHDFEKIKQRFLDFLKSPEPNLRLEFKIIKPNGEEGYVIASSMIEYNQDHTPEHVHGLFLDFSDKYFVEKELRESRAKYQHLTDSLQEVVWKIGFDGNFIYMNPAFWKIFGLEENVGRLPLITDIFFPETIELIDKKVREELDRFHKEGRKGEITILELKGKHSDGSVIHMETSADFVLDDNGAPVAIQGILRDITKRKETEQELEEYRNNLESMVEQRMQELKENRSELQHVFDHSPVIMILLNSQFKILHVNEKGREFSGNEAGHLKNMILGNALNCQYNGYGCGGHKHCKSCQIRKIIQDTLDFKKEQTKIETQIYVSRNNKTEEHTVLVSTSLISSHTGTNILVTIDDITEQKQMQQALVDSEEKYRKLFETKHEAVLFFDSETKQYVDVNAAACKLYGYTRAELLEMTPSDISVEKEDTERNLKLIGSNGDTQVIPYRTCLRKNGQRVIVEIQNASFLHKGILTICSTHRDITEKERTLKKLQDSEQRFRVLIENIDKIFWLYNRQQGKLVYISPQYEKITGEKLEGIFETNRKLFSPAHPNDWPKIEAAIPRIIAGAAMALEYRIVDAKHEIKWLLLKSFGFYKLSSEEELIFGFITDITGTKLAERKVLNAILETENREREIFAKELHDGLGANLSAIKMSLEMLNSPYVKPEKKEFYANYSLELINQAATTAREISNNLKPHTLSNLGLVPSIEMLCSNINSLGNIDVTFCHSCKTKQFDKETELAIYRILSEFTNNSLKYARASKAHIELSEKNDKLTLEYSDNGKGFDPDKALQSKGSGLKNINARVEALGGEIILESKLDKGMWTKIVLHTKSLTQI